MDACKKIQFTTPAQTAGQLLSLIALILSIVAAFATTG